MQKRLDKMQGRFVGENNPFYGKHHTEETKRVISEKKREFLQSEFEREKMRKRRLGTTTTDEVRQRISETLRGRSRPDDVRLKIKRTNIGVFYVNDEELDGFSRSIERFRQRGETYRCAHCGQEFKPKFRNRLFSIFCCPECRDEWNSDHYPAQIRPLSRV